MKTFLNRLERFILNIHNIRNNLFLTHYIYTLEAYICIIITMLDIIFIYFQIKKKYLKKYELNF